MRSFLPIRKACLAILSLTMLIAQLPLQAQADHTTEDFQTWQVGSVEGHISKRILYYFDTQNNVVNLTDKKGNSAHNDPHEGQLIIRSGLGYQLTKGWSLWQGYGWAPNFQPQYRNEQQIWEQAFYRHRFKHVFISNRSRMEIRWIHNTSGETALRFRNQFRIAVPIGRTRWALVAFDEPFFNMNSVHNGPRAGFNQNWAFIGIERNIDRNRTINLDVGYLNNYVRNFRPVPDRINNAIFVSLNMNMPGTGFYLRKQPLPSPAKTGIIPTVPLEDLAVLRNSQPNIEIAPIMKAETKTKAVLVNETTVPMKQTATSLTEGQVTTGSAPSVSAP